MTTKLNNVYALETKETYHLKEGTKTVWVLDKTEENNVTEDQYNKVVCPDTQRWFRRTGGSEYAEKEYTKKGYLITRLISKNPSRDTKVIHKYNFDIKPSGATA